MKNDICFEPLYWIDDKTYNRRVIVSAANRFTLKDGQSLVIPCVRHYSKDLGKILDVLEKTQLLDIQGFAYGDDQGFIDQYSNYWNRADALIIATGAGQINTRREKGSPLDLLFSEDLY